MSTGFLNIKSIKKKQRFTASDHFFLAVLSGLIRTIQLVQLLHQT